MVTLNLTIAVEVGLFLLFLWLMNTFVFRPLLKVMDQRDAQIEDDKTTSQTENQAAAAREKEYTSKVRELRSEASHAVYHARRAAQHVHNEQLEKLKKEEEAELLETREEAMRQIEAERAKYPECIAALAGAMAERLGLKRDGL